MSNILECTNNCEGGSTRESAEAPPYDDTECYPRATDDAEHAPVKVYIRYKSGLIYGNCSVLVV